MESLRNPPYLAATLDPVSYIPTGWMRSALAMAEVEAFKSWFTARLQNFEIKGGSVKHSLGRIENGDPIDFNGSLTCDYHHHGEGSGKGGKNC